jgi:steroid delta-isomerase-like uncharacterized protein
MGVTSPEYPPANIMSTSALIESYYAAFNGHDWDGMLALLTDDVVHDINQGDREVGIEAFRAFLGSMDRSYAEQVTELVVMVSADGSRGAAEFIIEGQYLTSDPSLPEARGQRYTLPVGAFFEIRDDKIARVTNYYNLRDWIRQVEN